MRCRCGEKPRDYGEERPRRERKPSARGEKPRDYGEERPRRDERKPSARGEKPRDYGEERPRRARKPREQESNFGAHNERRERRKKEDYGRTPPEEISIYEMPREKRGGYREAAASFRNGLGKPARRSSGAKKGETFNRHDTGTSRGKGSPKDKPAKGKKPGKGGNSGKSWYMD